MKITRSVTAFVAAGMLALTLAACSSASVSDFAGYWGSSSSGQPNVTIGKDGSFHGTDGCNRITGKGTVTGDAFSFGTFASTLMACPGVTTWFNKAATAKKSDDKLDVFDTSGSQIGTLAAQ